MMMKMEMGNFIGVYNSRFTFKKGGYESLLRMCLNFLSAKN